ncbi:DinB family protein [Deminuibacter soli]|uniref:DUF664 domain-containing protein n=1 Tax=Deminuibacter soli TaxID=2291815 RepID=A0A3E1NIU3_9BACT|nr:DinB family protein [Deminuibacter soli]RFM27850.1 DUF664 domain-containing protein [Deminuibacter soli]
MSKIETLQKVLEQEAITTRKMLSRVPDEQLDWQPHPKSMTLRRLAAHVAELPGWVGMVFNTNELDFQQNNYAPRTINDSKELMQYFDENLQDAREQLKKAEEDQLDELWTLRSGAQIYSTEPKEEVLRMTYSQIIHHRAQLGVYLRLLDIPIPGSYGPSADETGH